MWITSCSTSRSCAQPEHTVCDLLLPLRDKLAALETGKCLKQQSLSSCGLSVMVPVQRSCRLRTDTGVPMADLSQGISSACAPRAFCCGAQPQ